MIYPTKASLAEYSAEGPTEYSASRRFSRRFKMNADFAPNADKQGNKSGRGGLHLAFCHHMLSKTGKGGYVVILNPRSMDMISSKKMKR